MTKKPYLNRQPQIHWIIFWGFAFTEVCYLLINVVRGLSTPFLLKECKVRKAEKCHIFIPSFPPSPPPPPPPFEHIWIQFCFCFSLTSHVLWRNLNSDCGLNHRKVITYGFWFTGGPGKSRYYEIKLERGLPVVISLLYLESFPRVAVKWTKTK